MHHSNDYNVNHSLQIPEILSRPLMKHGTLHDFFSKALYAPGSQFYLFFKSGKDPQLVNLFKKILKEYQAQKRYSSSMINALLEILNFITQLSPFRSWLLFLITANGR